MPIPKPNKGEKQEEYIARCNKLIYEEYPDNKIRNGICFSTWRAKDKKDEYEDRNFKLKLDYAKSNFKIDKDTGFLTCDAYLTRSGVFDYYDEDGNLIRELRSDEEVFDKESLDSLKLKPIILTHDGEKITVDNVKKFQKGTTGENIVRDGKYVKSRIVITDKDTVEMINGRRYLGLSTELSCGYKCKIDYKIGSHPEDGYYTFAQKKIKYNHVAIVEHGRAGSNVRILDQKGKPPFLNFHTCRLTNPDQYQEWGYDKDKVKINKKPIDFVYGIKIKESKRTSELQSMRYNKKDWASESARNHCLSHDGSFIAAKKKEEKKTMIDEKKIKFNIKAFDSKHFKMDGLTGFISEESIEMFDSLNEKLNKACNTITKLSNNIGELQGKNDQLNEVITAQKKDIVELSDLNSERMKSIINTRNEIVEVASKLKVDHVGKSNVEVMVGCIQTISDGFDSKNKDENYIKGRFDTIKESIDTSTKNDGMVQLADFIDKAKLASAQGNEKKDPRADFIKMDKEKNRK